MPRKILVVGTLYSQILKFVKFRLSEEASTMIAAGARRVAGAGLKRCQECTEIDS
jgi:hypothetical protein